MKKSIIATLLFFLFVGQGWTANCGDGVGACACGDTVTADYTLTGNLSCTNAGAALTIGASNTTLDLGGYTIDGDSTNVLAGIDCDGYDTLTIRNGTISDTTGAGVDCYEGAERSDYTTIEYITTIDTDSNGIKINGVDNTIRHNIVSGAGTAVGVSTNGHGIYVDATGSNWTYIYGNEVSGSGTATQNHDGILFGGGGGTVYIYDNYSYDNLGGSGANLGAGIDASDFSADDLILNIYNNRVSGCKWGLSTGSVQPDNIHNVYNNIVTGFYYSGLSIRSRGVYNYYNNTVVGSGSQVGGIRFVNAGEKTVNLKNNIVMVTSDNAFNIPDATDVTLDEDYNLFYRTDTTDAYNYEAAEMTLAEWQAATDDGDNSISSDPLFIDAANENFRLQVVSPAIDAGVMLSNMVAGEEILSHNFIDNGDFEATYTWTSNGFDAVSCQTWPVSDTTSCWFSSPGSGDYVLTNTYATITGNTYQYTFDIYPFTYASIRVLIRSGDDSGWAYNYVFSGLTLTAWNRITFDVADLAGGDGAYMQIQTTGSGSFNLDDISCRLKTNVIGWEDFYGNRSLYGDAPDIGAAQYNERRSIISFPFGRRSKILAWYDDPGESRTGIEWKDEGIAFKDEGIKWLFSRDWVVEYHYGLIDSTNTGLIDSENLPLIDGAGSMQ